MSHNNQSSPLIWGNRQIATSTAPRWLSFGFDSSTAQTQAVEVPAPRPGRLQRLRVQHGTPRGNGVPIVYTLHVNGIPTALTVSLASTGSDAADLNQAHGVTVVGGDKLSLVATKSASIGQSPLNVTASMDLV